MMSGYLELTMAIASMIKIGRFHTVPAKRKKTSDAIYF